MTAASPQPTAKEIMALDDKDGNLQLKGLAWVPVRSMEEFQEVYSIFRNGCAERKVCIYYRIFLLLLSILFFSGSLEHFSW